MKNGERKEIKNEEQGASSLKDRGTRKLRKEQGAKTFLTRAYI